MKTLKLTQGKVALLDSEDFERASAFSWYAWKSTSGDGRTFYARRSFKVGRVAKTQLLHQFITGLSSVDHINEDGLDCRRSNLRACSASGNGANRRKFRGLYSSKYKGVSFHRLSGKWSAYLTCSGRRVHLGLFFSEVNAARTYDREAVARFGEFANLNFPSQST